MLHILITHTYSDITSYDYDIFVRSGSYTAQQIIDEVNKYAVKQDIKCKQEHHCERCYILTGLTPTNQLWQATIRWGLTPKEVRGIFNYE